MRVRLEFTKLGKIRFTSHRDVARMFERAFVLMPLRDLAPELVPADWEDPPASDVRSIGAL